jgi:hypothetical protein
MASLPPLPSFERAERLPINQVRLLERLNMLEPDDWVIVERTVLFLAWQRQPVERTDSEVVVFFRQIMELTASHPVLRQMIEFRMNVRTILAALRRRHRGLPAPAVDEPWGVGPWVQHVTRHWDDADFKLRMVFQWIPQARQYLEAGEETLALERLLMRLIWEQVDFLTQNNLFGFDALLAYLFKWDIVQRWLSYNRETAQARFDALVTEVIGEHDQLFEQARQSITT